MKARKKEAKVVKLTGGKQTREIFFNEGVFDFLEQQEISGQEEWLYETIATAIRGNFEPPTPIFVNHVVYISNESSENFGLYRVWVVDRDGNQLPIIIDLVTATAKKEEHQSNVLLTAKPEINNVTFYPPGLNPDPLKSDKFSEAIKANTETLKREKERQAKQFRDATENFEIKVPPAPPITRKVYDTSSYTLEESLALFPTEFALVRDGLTVAKQTRDGLNNFTKRVNESLPITSFSVEEQRELKSKFFEGLEGTAEEKLRKLESTLGIKIHEEQEEQASLPMLIERDTKLICISHKNLQEKLSNLKNALAHAIYKAALEYYDEEVQKGTKGNPEERQKKIKSFNQHFGVLGCLSVGKDGSLSDIQLVYRHMQGMSLREIQDYVNKLLQNGASGNAKEGCDSSIFFNSTKLTKMVQSINDTAAEISKEIRADHNTLLSATKEPLFSAVGKKIGLTRTLIKKAEFRWHPEILRIESDMEEQVQNVKKRVREGIITVAHKQTTHVVNEAKTKQAKDYVELRQTKETQAPLATATTVVRSLVLDETNGLLKKFTPFSRHVTDLKKAKDQQEVAKELDKNISSTIKQLDTALALSEAHIEKIAKFNRLVEAQRKKQLQENSEQTEEEALSIVDIEKEISEVANQRSGFESLKKALAEAKKDIDIIVTKFPDTAPERKRQLEELEARLTTIRDISKRLTELGHGTLSTDIQITQNKLNHHIQTIDLIEESRNNKKLFIQKRIQNSLESLEVLAPKWGTIVFTDPQMVELTQTYHNLMKDIKDLQLHYAKNETGIEKVDRDIKLLDTTYNKVLEQTQKINDAISVRHRFIKLLETLAAFDRQPKEGIQFNTFPNQQQPSPYQQDAAVEVSQIESLLVSSQKMTKAQKEFFAIHLNFFKMSAQFLDDMYQQHKDKYSDTRTLSDMFALEHDCATKKEIYNKTLYAIREFPNLVSLQNNLTKWYEELNPDQPSSWRRKVAEYPDDKYLRELIERLETYKRSIDDHFRDYATCDIAKFLEDGISIKELSTKLKQDFEAAESCKDEIYVYLSRKLQMEELKKDISVKIDPALECFGVTLEKLRAIPGDETLTRLIRNYDTSADILDRCITPYKEKDIKELDVHSVHQARVLADRYFQSVADRFAEIERHLALMNTKDGKFLEDLVVSDPYKEGESISPKYLISQHRLLCDLIAVLDSKYVELSKKYATTPTEDWPSEGKATLESMYRMKKLRRDLEENAGNKALGALRAQILKAKDDIAVLKAFNPNGKTRDEKRIAKEALKQAEKHLVNLIEKYVNEKGEFYKTLSAKESVNLNFYKEQVSSMIDLMTRFDISIASNSSLEKKERMAFKTWMESLRAHFSMRLNALTEPFSVSTKKPKVESQQPEVHVDLLTVPSVQNRRQEQEGLEILRLDGNDAEEQPPKEGKKVVEPKLSMSPTISRLNRLCRVESSKEIIQDIREMDIDALEQFEKEVADFGTFVKESSVPSSFLEIDKIMSADPCYSTHLLGREMTDMDYNSLIAQLKEQQLYAYDNQKRVAVTEQVYKAFQKDEISLITLLRLVNLLNPPTQGDHITLEKLDESIHRYQNRKMKSLWAWLKGENQDDKKGVFRWFNGDSKTVRDLTMLSAHFKNQAFETLKKEHPPTEEELKADRKNPGTGYDMWCARLLKEKKIDVAVKIKETKIPAQYFELIAELRNSRSSWLRNGSYQHRSLSLFSKGPEETKKMSHTESLINSLGEAVVDEKNNPVRRPRAI